MKLTFQEDFELEVGDTTLTGTFRALTKKEQKEAEKKQKPAMDKVNKVNKLINETSRLKNTINISKKLEDWEQVKELNAKLESKEDELNKLDQEIEKLNLNDFVYKDRLLISVSGDDKSKIMEIGEEYGYQRVFETIQQDIAEKKK